MSKNSSLFGVVLGAAIVGATLIVRDAVADPEKSAAMRQKVQEKYQKVKAKIGEGYAFVCQKAEEAGENIRTAVENDKTVQKIKQKVKDVRRATEPAETYFAEADAAPAEKEAEGNTAAVVVETEAGIRDAQ